MLLKGEYASPPLSLFWALCCRGLGDREESSDQSSGRREREDTAMTWAGALVTQEGVIGQKAK